MWIKFEKREKGKPMFELGPKRKPDDPFRRLGKALIDLKQSVKKAFAEDLAKLKRLFSRKRP